MRIRVLGVAIVLIVVSNLPREGGSQQAGSRQQSPETSTATLKMQVREVILPVTVRDKKGALVPGLQKSDFTLTDEGRPQSIKGFSHDSDLPFRVGLLVDTSRSMNGAMENERKAANKFVDDMLPSTKSETRDQAFLIHFDREVELLQDFTSAAPKLHHELDDMGPTKPGQNNNQGPETTGDDRDRPRNGRGGTQLYDAIYLACDELMASKDGRKALVVFSDGVDRGSKDRLPEAIDAADRANVAIYTVYYKGEQERSQNEGFPGGGRRGGGYPGGGGGYPGGGSYPGGGYPGGGRRTPTTSETGVDGKKIMQQIAARTGGHAFEAKKKDDLEAIYNLINEELRGQYVLTYTPDKIETDGSFHKVALQPNNKDYTVVTREGYFAPDSSK